MVTVDGAGVPAQRDGAWFVPRPRDASAALAATSTFRVARPAGDGGPADVLLSRMARFTDDAAHDRRRELVIRLLPPLTAVIEAAASLASSRLPRRPVFDVMPAARLLPAASLAAAMSLEPGRAMRAARLVGLLCDAVAPRLSRSQPAPEVRPGQADQAASGLSELLAAGGADEESVAAMAGILFQARDATAALIGLTVLAGQPGPAPGPVPPRQRVQWVLRHDAPVRRTSRRTAAPTAIGGVSVPPGATVWLSLAPAMPGGPGTFGSGTHACPGSVHAAAIAEQVVAAIEDGGWHAARQSVEFEPRPNLTMPRQVLVTRT